LPQYKEGRLRYNWNTPIQLSPSGTVYIGSQFLFRSPGRTVRLTRAELAIMVTLFRKPGQVLSADDLLQQALEYPRGVGSPDTVHTHVRNLRHKIEADPSNPRIVRTVIRLGYRLEPDPQAE
jgi:DNA-binding response OmpR family regulator